MMGPWKHALQRTSTANRKQIFPEKEFSGHSPNFHIHVSVSDLYIPTIDLPNLLQETRGQILGIYKLLTDTRMWKLGLGRAIPRKGIHEWDFRCSAGNTACFRMGCLAASFCQLQCSCRYCGYANNRHHSLFSLFCESSLRVAVQLTEHFLSVADLADTMNSSEKQGGARNYLLCTSMWPCGANSNRSLLIDLIRIKHKNQYITVARN